MAGIGTICIISAEWRQHTVARAIKQGDFAEPSAILTAAITAIISAIESDS